VYPDTRTPQGNAAIRFVEYMLGLAAVLILVDGPAFELQKRPQLRLPFAYFAKGGYDDGIHNG
jgi:hypothetical protein